MKRETNTILLAIIAVLLWSSAFAVIKVGLQYNEPFQFAGIRFTLSGLMLLPLAMRNNGYFSIITKNLPFILIVSLLQVSGLYALFYNGMNMVPGAIGAIIVGTGPLFVAFMSHFLMHNDRMVPKKMFVMLLGFSGIVLVSLGKKSTGGGADFKLLGVLLLLGSNTLGGYVNVFIAKSRTKVPAVVLSSTSLIVGGLCLFLLSIPIEGIKTGPFPLEYWASLSWLSMLSAVAFSIWFTLLKRPGIKLSSLNMWKFLVPISGAILSWIIVKGENPDMLTIAGMMLTGVSLILITRVDRGKVKVAEKKKN